jgi:hypothetical protein
MGKKMDDSVPDTMLAKIATATRLVVTSAEPANFAGIAAVTLGSYVMTAGLGGGDYSAAANGDTSGRKVTVGAQSGNNASASGTATHVCLDDGTTLLYVTTCPSVATNSGQPFNVAAWDIEILDPT